MCRSSCSRSRRARRRSARRRRRGADQAAERVAPRAPAASRPGLAGAGLARDGAALTGLIHRRRIGIVHSNTSVVLAGAPAAALARIPHIWHVREIYSRFATPWAAYRRLLLTASTLPCVSHATAAQFGGSGRARVIPDGLALDSVRRPALRPAARWDSIHPRR